MAIKVGSRSVRLRRMRLVGLAALLGFIGAAIAIAPAATAGASDPAQVVQGTVSGVDGVPTLPDGTDLTTLTASQLAYYNLPARPAAGSPNYQGWYTALKDARHRIAYVPGPNSVGPAIHPAVSPPIAGQAQNWSGWVAATYNYYGVQGAWNVPSTFNNAGALRGALQWVGIGGTNQSTGQLVQAGSYVYTQNGGANYATWFEVYPDQPTIQYLPIGVSPGNTMFVSLNSSRSQSYIFVENESTGAYVNVNPRATADGCYCHTAEAIDENAWYNGVYNPMAFVNPIYFSGVAPQSSGGSNWLGNFPLYYLDATDPSGNVISAPTGLTNINSFTINRSSGD